MENREQIDHEGDKPDRHPALVVDVGGLAHRAILGVVYWAIAGPFIGLACAAFYATPPVQLSRRFGVISAAVSITMVVAALVVGISLGDSSGGAPLLAVAAGLGAFAWFYRSVHVGVVALANLVGAVTMFTDDSDRTADLTFLLIGATSCAVAIAALLVNRTDGLRR